IQYSDHRQPAHEFGNQTEADQILRFGLQQKLGVAFAGFSELPLFLFAGTKAHGLLANAASYDLFEAYKRAAADEQDVGGIDGRELLVGVLASALRGDVGDGAFQNLEQRLLHALTADVASDGGILILAPDLVDFVDIDDAGLGAAYIAVGGLK